jgi:hypothetical protein
MAWGPGKYDAEVTALRLKLHADGVLIYVLNGERGSSFCAQLPPAETFAMPAILRALADQIERSGVQV